MGRKLMSFGKFSFVLLEDYYMYCGLYIVGNNSACMLLNNINDRYFF